MSGIARGIGVAFVVAVAGCSAFESEAASDAPPASRSVKCGAATCTGKQLCCADNPPTCGESCTTAYATLACDDASDCAAGQVCCLEVELTDSSDVNVLVRSASCRASCSPPNRPRSCDPLGANQCDGRSCVPLLGATRKVYPGGLGLSICE
jgi:hypothetical protein